MDNMHKIDFTVNLTGSRIFDTYMSVAALRLCNKYPGLDYTKDDNVIRVFGELNDYWFELYNTAQLDIAGVMRDYEA